MTSRVTVPDVDAPPQAIMILMIALAAPHLLAAMTASGASVDTIALSAQFAGTTDLSLLRSK